MCGRSSSEFLALRVTMPREKLSVEQRELIDEWLPGASVMADHSWGLVGTTVLELEHGEHRYVAKAGDATDTQLVHEIRAHREWLTPLTSNCSPGFTVSSLSRTTSSSLAPRKEPLPGWTRHTGLEPASRNGFVRRSRHGPRLRLPWCQLTATGSLGTGWYKTGS